MANPVSKVITKRRGVTRVEVYRDSAGEWRWRAFSSNGNNVANSGEGFAHRGHAIRIAGKLFPGATVLELA